MSLTDGFGKKIRQIYSIIECSGTHLVINIPNIGDSTIIFRIVTHEMSLNAGKVKVMVQTIDYRETRGERSRRMDKAVPGSDECRLCPHVHKPFDHCYCTSTSSLFAEATIYYCGGNYKECEIFMNHRKKGEGKA